MEELNFPKYEFRFSLQGQKKLIFDSIRKKFVVLTPEEWVRQHIINYLSVDKNIPQGLIAIENGVKIFDSTKRTDLRVYGKNGQALVLIECKAPYVKIDQKVLNQIAVYNFKLKIPYLMISNGLFHVYCKIDFEKQSLEYLKELPNYEQLQAL